MTIKEFENKGVINLINYHFERVKLAITLYPDLVCILFMTQKIKIQDVYLTRLTKLFLIKQVFEIQI